VNQFRGFYALTPICAPALALLLAGCSPVLTRRRGRPLFAFAATHADGGILTTLPARSRRHRHENNRCGSTDADRDRRGRRPGSGELFCRPARTRRGCGIAVGRCRRADPDRPRRRLGDSRPHAHGGQPACRRARFRRRCSDKNLSRRKRPRPRADGRSLQPRPDVRRSPGHGTSARGSFECIAAPIG